MTIRSIIRDGKGTAGAWNVRTDADTGRRILRHYTTDLLAWYHGMNDPRDTDVVVLSLGHGSVSDQNGCNTAFRVLSSPRYYSRAGGAAIS